MSPFLSGAPAPYSLRYQQRAEATPAVLSWVAVLGVSVVGGLFAVVGAFFTELGPFGPWVWGPTSEEMLKIGAIAMLVETRPWFVRNSGQILIAAALSALSFATIENLLYLYFYIPDPSVTIAAWRWHITTLLHISATLVASLGVVRMWRRSRSGLVRPQFVHTLGYLIAAIVLHGGYNLAVTIWQPR